MCSYVLYICARCSVVEPLSIWTQTASILWFDYLSAYTHLPIHFWSLLWNNRTTEGRKLSISVSPGTKAHTYLSFFTIRDYLTFSKAKWRPSRCPFYNSLIFSIGYLSYSCSNFYKVGSIHLYLQLHLYYQHFQIKNIMNAPTQNIISRYEHKYFQVIS